MVNPHFKMIRFIRLLFYHIYIYYYKKDNGNKALANFTTLLIFTLIFSFFISSFYELIFKYYNNNYTSLSKTSYIVVFIIIGCITAYCLYKKGFQDFNEYNDYNKKYYLYFFTIIIIILCLIIYTGKISRERILKQREIQKEYIENKK